MLTQDMIDTLTMFFNWVDTNQDGFISLEEIKNACAVDLDGNGTIDDSEKLACAKAWIETYLPLQDLDGDSRVSLSELLAFNNNSSSL